MTDKNQKKNQVRKTISHIILEGTNYEVGKYQGELIKNNDAAIKYFAGGRFNHSKSGFENHKDLIEFYNQYLPGITDELQGFADALNLPLENLVTCDHPYSIVNQCSHMVLLPSITKDGDIFVTRTYDWHYDDEDMRLLTTKVKGNYSHIGFSTLLTGRTDGMNSEGLCVTMSGGGAWDAEITEKKAFNFSLAIRVILDKCSNTSQAIKLLQELPVNTSTHYLIADKKGDAAIVEGFDCEYAVREVNLDSKKQYLYSTNYYKSKKMKHLNKFVNYYLKKMNPAREKVIDNFLIENSPNIDRDQLISLLSEELPKGLSTPYYSEWFGNLWTMIFNVTSGSIDINMGTASMNPWHTFSLENPPEEKNFDVIYVDTKSGFA